MAMGRVDAREGRPDLVRPCFFKSYRGNNLFVRGRSYFWIMKFWMQILSFWAPLLVLTISL